MEGIKQQELRFRIVLFHVSTQDFLPCALVTRSSQLLDNLLDVPKDVLLHLARRPRCRGKCDRARRCHSSPNGKPTQDDTLVHVGALLRWLRGKEYLDSGSRGSRSNPSRIEPPGHGSTSNGLAYDLAQRRGAFRPLCHHLLPCAFRDSRRMRTGVTANHVPSASEFPDLLFREKGR